MAMALPFLWLGRGLRALSLSGTPGNAAAIALYALASLTPLLWVLRDRRAHLTWAASGYLFYLLYAMVNPQILSWIPGGSALREAHLTVLAAIFWSLLMGQAALCAIRTRQTGIVRALRWLIGLGGMALLFEVFYGGTRALLAAWQNSGSALPHVMAAVLFMAEGAPRVMLWSLIPLGLTFVGNMKQTPFSAENRALVLRMAQRSRAVVGVTVGCMIGANALQLALCAFLSDVSFRGVFPTFELGISCALVLLAKIVERGYALQQDSELMI